MGGITSDRARARGALSRGPVLTFDSVFVFPLSARVPPQVEKQNRYAFLQYYVEAEQEERERAEEHQHQQRRKANGEEKKKKKRDRPADTATDSIEEHKSTPTTDDGVHSVAAPPGSQQGVGGSGGAGAGSRPVSHHPHLLPRTNQEELALLHQLNAAERAEDPFYLSRVAQMFLPVQKVTKSVTHEDGGENGDVGGGAGGGGGGGVGSPILDGADTRSDTYPHGGPTTSKTSVGGPGDQVGSVTYRQADGTFVTTSTTTETVYSNDPLYSTLSIMRAKGITSMPEFIRLLAHQNKVRLASNKISELPCMCCASELPAWFTSYPYVETKYRVNYTAPMCARSIFEWHNETINIWTEFVPCVVFLFGLILLESTNPVIFRATTPAWDRFFVLIGLLGGVVIRPLCSGLAHTFYPMSNRAFIIWSDSPRVAIFTARIPRQQQRGEWDRFSASPSHLAVCSSAALASASSLLFLPLSGGRSTTRRS